MDDSLGRFRIGMSIGDPRAQAVVRLDPRDMPVLRVEFTCADGEVIARSWRMDEAPPEWLKGESPDWVVEGSAGRKWDHPQDPVLLSGVVVEGREAEAREAVG